MLSISSHELAEPSVIRTQLQYNKFLLYECNLGSPCTSKRRSHCVSKQLATQGRSYTAGKSMADGALLKTRIPQRRCRRRSHLSISKMDECTWTMHLNFVRYSFIHSRVSLVRLCQSNQAIEEVGGCLGFDTQCEWAFMPMQDMKSK